MTYSTIIRKEKLCQCGCGRTGYIWSNGMLKDCANRVSAKKKIEETAERNKYYKASIARNIVKNKGKCRCDECGQEIKQPKGHNVRHIIGSGANKALYFHPLNHFIMGSGPLYQQCNCGYEFDNGTKRQSMDIYLESERRRGQLKKEHYESK